MRDDRQRQEGDLQERFRQDAAKRLGGLAQCFQSVRHLSNGCRLIRPAIGSASSAVILPAIGDREAAAQRDQPVDGDRHVVVVRADDGDVVAVMADR